MNIYKQTKTGNSQLLLIFSGWAASPEVFRQLETEPDTDLWICYDYRGMDFEGEALSGYRKIRLVAWSLGVWAASVMFGKKPVSFTEAIAVNGTPCPVHDRWGIPETIFRGTLDNVTEEGMRRSTGACAANGIFCKPTSRYRLVRSPTSGKNWSTCTPK